MDKKQKIIEKLLAHGGYTKAIAAKCCECIYDPDANGLGSWRQQVRACTTTSCPLYNFRPKSLAKENLDEEV